MADGKFVVARKDHRCTLCHALIFAGCRYWSERLTPWDHPDNDGYAKFKAHQRCLALWGSGYGAVHDYEFIDDHRAWIEGLWDLRQCKRAGVKSEYQMTDRERIEWIRTKVRPRLKECK